MRNLISTAKIVLTAALAVFPIQPAIFADVTVRGESSGRGVGQATQGPTVTYIKGSKMRTETPQLGGKSTILDAEAGRLIVLDHKKRQAEVTDVRDVSKAMNQVSNADIQSSVEPTGRTQQMLGRLVKEYQVTIRIGIAPIPDQRIDMVMSGPAWIAPDSPGRQDYAHFYLAAAEKGLFFGDPEAAKAQPGPAKGLTTLYKLLAEAGVPYSMDMQVKFEGGGMLAAMMSKMGGSSFSSKVTEISVEPLSDDLFEIPADYKVKKR